MSIKSYYLILSAICLAGCVASNALQYESMSETNLYHLAKVRKGMSERQVLQIMHKPYSYESFQVDDDIYDVWFYVTRSTGLDQTRMVPQNLTPLTFKNGTLVGTGYNWYYYAMKEQAMEAEAQRPTPAKPPSRDAEDKEFEKLLRAPPTKNGAPPKAAAPKDDGLQKALNVPTNHQKTPVKKPAQPVQKNQKLPPNVHIISESDALSTTEVEISPCCPQQDERDPNRFSILSKGLSEMQVFQTFGSPVKHETLEYLGDVYDVWFYETFPSKTQKPSKIPQHLTPITFKNAILISTQEDDFYELKGKIDTQILQEESEEKLAKTLMEQSKVRFLKPYVPKGHIAVSPRDFAKICIGMGEEEVRARLGEPAGKETYSIDGDVYETWFYGVASNRKKTPTRHLPITFKNERVVSRSMKYYNEVRKKAGKECIDCYTPAADRMQEDESEQNFNYW